MPVWIRVQMLHNTAQWNSLITGGLFFGTRHWFLISPIIDVPLETRLCAPINTLRPRQNGRRIADDTFKCIFLNKNVRISIKISLKFVPMVSINNIPALVQIIAWRGQGDKPLFEPTMVRLPTHICITRPQWVNPLLADFLFSIPAWISNHMPSKVWYEITYPFPNFNGCRHWSMGMDKQFPWHNLW